ncbi:YfiR family protein [Ekhidna sp.]
MSIKRNFSRKIIPLIALGLFLHSGMALAQSINPKFQAVFINGVARKFVWSSANSDFNILIVGNDKPLENELKKLAADRRINGKSVKVKMVSEISGSLIEDIVFVSKKGKDKLGSVINSASDDSIIMSAFDGALNSGSHVNFFLSGNKISFNLNQTAVNKTKVGVTEDLIKLASSVK